MPSGDQGKASSLGYSSLQTKESWMPNPVVGLKWSGPTATPHLAKVLIQQAKKQSFGVIFHPALPPSKSFQCREIVTVAHGTADLSELMSAIEAYYQELGPDGVRPTYRLELTVVTRDEGEYVEQKLPPLWRMADHE